MPEEKFVNESNKLEDRAWQDMLERLDTNLPVSKGLSGREILLIVLLLVISIGMGSYIIHLRSSGNEVPEKQNKPDHEQLFANVNKDNTQDKVSIVESEESIINQIGKTDNSTQTVKANPDKNIFSGNRTKSNFEEASNSSQAMNLTAYEEPRLRGSTPAPPTGSRRRADAPAGCRLLRVCTAAPLCTRLQ